MVYLYFLHHSSSRCPSIYLVLTSASEHMAMDTEFDSIHNYNSHRFDNRRFCGKLGQKELPARGVPGGKAIGLGAKGILYAIVFVTAITQLQIGAGILNTVIAALMWGIAGAIAIGLGWDWHMRSKICYHQ